MGPVVEDFIFMEHIDNVGPSNRYGFLPAVRIHGVGFSASSRCRFVGGGVQLPQTGCKVNVRFVLLQNVDFLLQVGPD